LSVNKYDPTNDRLIQIAGAMGLSDYQTKTLATPITIDGTTYTTVEALLGALGGAVGKITDAQWTQIQTILS